MRVHNPHTSLLAERDAKVKDWSRERTKRRLSTLAQLARPYRWRVVLGMVTLLLATATALALCWRNRTPNVRRPRRALVAS